MFGWFRKKSRENLGEGLSKTRKGVFARIREALVFRKLDEETIEELEEILIEADVGVRAATELVEALREAYRDREVQDPAAVTEWMKARIRERLDAGPPDLAWAASGPTVVLVCGINGSGKTTSIAKLASLYKKEGKKVMVAASDTFRAAAVEQLVTWCDRIGIDCIHHDENADPGAVAFDAAEAAKARGADLLLVDTAGRLHTAVNLMKELGKIHRVVGRVVEGAPHEVLLVLDATAGQNALVQARQFREVVGVTGVILAKLDGTARGGIVLAIREQLGIPVRFVGTGETPDDVALFDPDVFVDELFRENAAVGR